jgi:tRNA dimethylallyltransferase
MNADSQQMYRELRILTARPSPEDEARVPHRLYGALSASEYCSAGSWLNLARMEIDWVLKEGGVPIVVGGTGLYIRALLQGMADIPDIDPMVRRQARGDMEAMGHDAFHERLRAVDPVLGEKLRTSDTQRLVRAYEVWLGTGKPLSWWQAREVMSPYPSDHFTLFRVDIPRDVLYDRCNRRLIAMMEQGALDEVKLLLSMKLASDLPAMKSVGVKELSAYIKGEIGKEEAIAAAQQATRNYAKRQLTWFRHQLSAFETNVIDTPEKIPSMLNSINQ